MDDKTLASLKAVFAAGPSAELAKVIALQLIHRKELADLMSYLKLISGPMDHEDAVALASAAMELADYQTALTLLQTDVPEQAILIVRCHLELNQLDKAREIYDRVVDAHPKLATAELNRRLNKSVANEPIKLRVVEKSVAVIDFGQAQTKNVVTRFSDVVGLEDVKKQIHKKIILPFQKPSLFQRFKKKVGGGILLYGPPGCGKTLLARATAGECNANFFNVEISDILDMYIGESEQKLHAFFEKARSQSPSVLFFDEIEGLAGKREHSRNSSQANTVSQFLTELDGFAQKNEGVLILGSTNVPWALDAAFLRPGRFDRMFFVPPPDKVARVSILEHHMRDRPSVNDIQFDVIAAKTSGYSGADLANLVEMAADEAIDNTIDSGQDVAISMAHFLAALAESRSSTTEWLTTARNYARYANDGGRYDDVLAFINQHGK